MIKLKEQRIKKGLNMRETARLLGMPYTTYVGYEKGDREPNSETLVQLAHFFGCSVDTLLGRATGTPSLIDQEKAIETAKVALFGGASEFTDEMWDEVTGFVEYIKQREKKKKDDQVE